MLKITKTVIKCKLIKFKTKNLRWMQYLIIEVKIKASLIILEINRIDLVIIAWWTPQQTIKQTK